MGSREQAEENLEQTAWSERMCGENEWNYFLMWKRRLINFHSSFVLQFKRLKASKRLV